MRFGKNETGAQQTKTDGNLMETGEELFQEDQLKQVVLFITLVASVEGLVHETEWESIRAFIDDYWQADYGCFATYQKELFNEVKQLLNKEEEYYEKIDSLIETFAKQFSPEQKTKIMDLIGKLISSDCALAIEEAYIYAALMKRLDQ